MARPQISRNWVKRITSKKKLVPLILFGKWDSYALETKLFIDSLGTVSCYNTSSDFIMVEVFILFHRLAAHAFFSDILVFVVSASFGHEGEVLSPEYFLALLSAFDCF